MQFNPDGDPMHHGAYEQITTQDRIQRSIEQSELLGPVEGDGPIGARRRSPLAIVAWIVAGAVVVLAVLALTGKIHL